MSKNKLQPLVRKLRTVWREYEHLHFFCQCMLLGALVAVVIGLFFFEYLENARRANARSYQTASQAETQALSDEEFGRLMAESRVRLRSLRERLAEESKQRYTEPAEQQDRPRAKTILPDPDDGYHIHFIPPYSGTDLQYEMFPLEESPAKPSAATTAFHLMRDFLTGEL